MAARTVAAYGVAGPEKVLENLFYPLYVPDKVFTFVVDNWLQGLVSAGTLVIAKVILEAGKDLGHPWVGTGLAIFYVATAAFVGNVVQNGIGSANQDDYSENPGTVAVTATVEDTVFYVLSLAVGEATSDVIDSWWSHIKGFINQLVRELEE